MKYVWAPWRIGYIRAPKPEGCILCDKPKQDTDAENYILYRGRLNFVMLNAYPYNPGHLLVAPYRHAAGLTELNEKERNEHYQLVSRGIEVLKKAFNPAGYNIGSNLGKVAGAGIDDHFHSHIVPRWQGDNNFVPVLADVRVIPQSLEDTYKDLVTRF
jgi:ATP adenylyltransferase